MMTIYDVLNWFQQTAFGLALGRADHLFGAVLQLIHILGFVLLLTAVVLVNLRLLGMGLKRQVASVVTDSTIPLLWIGLLAAVFSGVLIFLSGPLHYYPNEAFWLKLILLVLVVAFQVSIYRKVISLEAPGAVVVKSVAVLSLTLWFGVGVAGRAIGFI
ncbi:hypothetical protein MTYP_02226 [Methylophilaceae bacterium]|nr:hypothetical protein MTYP_02226 [Methylophilaceae bacterium]